MKIIVTDNWKLYGRLHWPLDALLKQDTYLRCLYNMQERGWKEYLGQHICLN
jgi:hypothetical protein